jgi:hypothetical protein
MQHCSCHSSNCCACCLFVLWVWVPGTVQQDGFVVEWWLLLCQHELVVAGSKQLLGVRTECTSAYAANGWLFATMLLATQTVATLRLCTAP